VVVAVVAHVQVLTVLHTVEAVALLKIPL